MYIFNKTGTFYMFFYFFQRVYILLKYQLYIKKGIYVYTVYVYIYMYIYVYIYIYSKWRKLI